MNMLKQQDSTNSSDFLGWGSVVILLVGGLAANYYYVQVPFSLRIVAWVVLACIVLLIAAQTAKGRQGWLFFKEARNEMRKVVWPTRHETVQTTLIVLALVVIFALILWVADSLLMLAVNWLMG